MHLEVSWSCSFLFLLINNVAVKLNQKICAKKTLNYYPSNSENANQYG